MSYKSVSRVTRPLTERARSIRVVRETPLEHLVSYLEVISDHDGNYGLSIKHGTKKKVPSDSRWEIKHVFVTLSPEAWEHLHTAPKFTPPDEKEQTHANRT